MLPDATPSRVLVILLGASEWPKSPEFRESPAFLNSARRIEAYFLDKKKFGLPKDNLLDLFDSSESNDELDEKISDWLKKKVSPGSGGERPTDLIVIFIGHGGFVNGHDEYFFAIRRTRAENPGASSIRITTLAKTIRESARFLRRYIILDCCFAASAYSYFQSEVAQAATKQALDAFARPGREGGGQEVPTRGTTLLCSSRHDKPSLLSPGEELTMFSEALLHALEQGAPNTQERVSLETVGALAEDYLRTKYEDEAPRPEVHSPDQREGNVAAIPIFPNPGMKKPITAPPSTVRSEEFVSDIRGLDGRETTVSESGGDRESRWAKWLNLISEHPAPAGIASLCLILMLVVGFFFIPHSLSVGPKIDVSPTPTPAPSPIPIEAHVYQYQPAERPLKAHAGSVLSLAFSPNGVMLASGGTDNTVKVWDAMTRSPQKSLSTAYRYVTAVGFSSDGDILGYTNNDKPITIEDSGVITDDKEGRGQIELWSIQTWTQVNRLISNDRLLTSISFSSDDTHLVSSNGLGRIAFWDYKKTSAAFVDASTDSVYQAVYSPDGKLVASTGFDGQIHVWDALKYPYSTVYSFMGDSRYTTSLSFSPDSNSLVANSKGDRKIKLWDVKNSKTVWVSGELREEVLVVSYSHTGGLVASAGADGTVRLWDAKTGELKQMFPGHGVACKSIAFSPDDRLLAGGYADGNIQIWEPAT